MKKKITIVGCGWLGQILVPYLKDHVLFTTTRKNFDVGHFTTVPVDITESDIIVYSIPPLALPLIEKFFGLIAVDKKILFISSTSVYGKSQGEVSEETKTDACLGNATLIGTEAYLQSRFKNLTILRPGGLYGRSRHPIKFLSGRTALTTGEEYTHLVHGEDVACAIASVIEKDIWGETFNLVSDLKMQKKLFYPLLAEKFGFTPPLYARTENSSPTIITNTKAKRIMGLTFHDPFSSLD